MKNITIHVLTGDPAIQPFVKSINKVVADAVKKISKRIHFHNVDIVISHRPQNVAFGVASGEAAGKNQITIALNVVHKQFAHLFKVGLRKTLAHELYHIARKQALGEAKTLIDDVVEEGLAIHFEQEVFGGNPPAYCYRNKIAIAKKMLAKFKKVATSKIYNYDDWFFGSRDKKIPKYTGYVIGYALVKERLKTDSDCIPSKLLNIGAVKILSALLDKKG